MWERELAWRLKAQIYAITVGLCLFAFTAPVNKEQATARAPTYTVVDVESENTEANLHSEFRSIFGISPTDLGAQASVNDYFNKSVYAACQPTFVQYGNPDFIKAQDVAEMMGFDVPEVYKNFRYGRKC